MTESTKHHYVPRWYQRRFLPEGETRFYYLNRRPYQTVNGRHVPMRDIERWGPAKCFQEANLYSVNVPGFPKDQFEKEFFGAYDHNGAIAVDEVANAGHRVAISHEGYQHFFAYLSVQALRTPKGMAWLMGHLGAQLGKRELLEGISRLRYIRTVMWVESFQEVLYTESDDIGFLISDHPVTSYNKACYAESAECRLPNDPDAAWKGTQTIFPLDAKRCFVLTHTEYAHNQDMRTQLRRPRTNARLFGNTIAKTHQIVHRQVSDAEVSRINQILKLRARRYLAAPFEHWLYPEGACNRIQWPDLGVPLVPKTELWRNTGGVYMGLKSGGVFMQDPFGRSPDTPEEQRQVEKEVEAMHAQLQKALANHKNNPNG